MGTPDASAIRNRRTDSIAVANRRSYVKLCYTFEDNKTSLNCKRISTFTALSLLLALCPVRSRHCARYRTGAPDSVLAIQELTLTT